MLNALLAETPAREDFRSSEFRSDPDSASANDLAIVAFNHLVQSDRRVENVCLTVRDGVMLAWKRR